MIIIGGFDNAKCIQNKNKVSFEAKAIITIALFVEVLQFQLINGVGTVEGR